MRAGQGGAGVQLTDSATPVLVNRRRVVPVCGRRRFGAAAVRYGVLVVALLALNYTVLAVLTGLGLALLRRRC
jgi:hypothetical protein